MPSSRSCRVLFGSASFSVTAAGRSMPFTPPAMYSDWRQGGSIASRPKLSALPRLFCIAVSTLRDSRRTTSRCRANFSLMRCGAWRDRKRIRSCWGRKTAVEKVVAFIIDQAAYSPGSNVVTLAMTRQDIADYLGLTVETVSRTFSHLEREALIEIPAARQIRPMDRDGLHDLNA